MESFETTLQRLRENGFKLTPQRLAVIRYLIGNTSHPKAETIHVDLRRKYPSLSFSTVYNTLNTLTSIGEIQALHIHDDHLNFDPDIAPHIHFLCSNCGNVFDIDMSESALSTMSTGEIDGHEIDTLQVILRGTCRNCRRGG